MKHLSFLSLACALLLGLAACGETGTPRERVENAFHKLTKACADKMGDYSGAEGLVLYTGSDRARKYKAFASADGEERQMLNRACFDVSKLMDGGNSYTITGFEEEPESEGTWYALSVSFPSGRSAQMAFLEVDGKMGLGDID